MEHTLEVNQPKIEKMYQTILTELEKGTLRLCCDTTGKAHPTKFESKPDSQLFLATYARQKMAKRGGRSFKASESN